ncbi:TorF family putative porin [Halopseudomonas sabulinigri]|uniref:TorF family putative porin n=1 Tax=Halopseudomonas sabulinigri TaxID=472181 RepID=A0ABP9ZPY0_9GAMM
MMKKLAVAVATASTLSFANMAHAEAFDTAIGEIDASMTVTLATDYIWRGQSQTDGAGAIQGSLDFAHESGLYIGAWASNVDADDFGGASVEIDYYAGYGGAITDDISYDLSWATYTYPKNSSIDVEEALASLSLYGFTLGAKYAYDPSSALYTYVDYGFDLPWDMGLGLHYGLTDTKDPLNGVDGDEEYGDWAVSIGKTVLGLDMALMYSDTDLGDDCAYSDSDSCDANFTFSVSKSL